MEAFDLAVIGGGTAGLVTSAGAALLGAKVALIERDRLGGECLHTGRVPSKALIPSAKVLHLIRGQPISTTGKSSSAGRSKASFGCSCAVPENGRPADTGREGGARYHGCLRARAWRANPAPLTIA